MLRILLLAILVAALSLGQGGNASPTGDWSGTLDLGAQKLRIVFHIKATPEGTFTATADSPDQGASGIPVTSVTSQGAAVAIKMANLGASFEGTLNEAGDEIKGTFQQGGLNVPLTLRRVTATELEAAKPKRPQIPVKPYPYDERELTVKPAEGVALACTLTTPRGEGPFPGAVTITGSGAQTRDEEVMGHPVFLVLADHLTRKGIAVLRCDDRGFGKSTGDFKAATTADFANDAEAAFDALRSEPKVDAKRCGLIGHSEGGVAAPVVAARRPEVAFVVLLAGTAVPGRQVILSQKEAILKAAGMSSVNLSADIAVYDAIQGGKDDAGIMEAGKALFPPNTPEEARRAQLQMLTSPWFRHFLGYDPAPALAKVKQPVLALFGEKDLQVLPAVNEPPLRAALKGNKNARIEIVPGVNHLFQTAKTGSPSEYAQIEETISPPVLETIAGWILSLK